MKRFELTLTQRKKESFDFISSDVIESDSLSELLTQFLFVIHRVSSQEAEAIVLRRQFPNYDDDIPF